MIDEAIRNTGISHLLAQKRDRIARPDNPSEAVSKEHDLLQAGVTLVLSEGVVEPSADGSADIAHLLTATIEYHRSGQFLTDLSGRVLDVQRILAIKGHSTGGRAPYGFGRFLVSPTGEVVEELTDGKRVRQEGYHVVWKPNDRDKIAVWISILEMKERGLGFRNIANILNDLGIPSPNAGRFRTDHGKRHKVSGLWNSSTVKSLCKNRSSPRLKSMAFDRRASTVGSVAMARGRSHQVKRRIGKTW